jgi:hypothetical protein
MSEHTDRCHVRGGHPCTCGREPAQDALQLIEQVASAHLDIYATEQVWRLASLGAVRSTGALDMALHAEEMRAWQALTELVIEVALDADHRSGGVSPKA